MSQFVTLNRIMKDDYHYNEAIKTLRTNIQFCGSGIKTIMLTSSLPDEGKSDITFAMASSLAQIGKKVVMIDADIRKSVLVSRYQLEREVSGLSQYLSGQRSLENVIYDTNIENFSMIFAGPYSPNPAELLEESLFGEQTLASIVARSQKVMSPRTQYSSFRVLMVRVGVSGPSFSNVPRLLFWNPSRLSGRYPFCAITRL